MEDQSRTKSVMMSGRTRGVRLGILLNAGMGIVFIIAAVLVVISVNYSMRQQALLDAQSKARLILDRNLATHTYFSHILKPRIFAWSEPFRAKEYFDPAWMSSTYAIREIEKYFKSISPSGYSFKDAALNARSPENEADEYERAFLEKLSADKKLVSESTVRTIDGKPYLIVLRKGEVMEESCLRCHSHPGVAPKGLIDYYGSERSFNRKTGDAVSAVSLRIPLSEAYAEANIFSLKLSTILLVVLAGLFATQYGLYRRYLLKPLNVIQEKTVQIATSDEHLGEQISQPFGRELNELATAFNEMSTKLRHDRDDLEKLVDKRTEVLLREKDFAESLIQTAQAIVLVLDTTGRIVSFNPYTEEVSGYPLKEVQGRDWFSAFIPERNRNRTRELFLKAISDIQTRGNIDSIVTKDGDERIIEWYDKTLKDEKGNTVGLLAIGQDITERKQLESKLFEARKMESLGQLASGAAHEIRNPLHIMSLRLQMLESMEKDLNENVRKAIDISNTQIKRILRVLDGLYEFSRIPQTKKAQDDLNKIIEEVVASQDERLRKEGIITDLRYGEAIPPFMLDKEKIATVIAHLISNAVDAMKDRETKKLGISTERTPAGESVRIIISDTGHGISETDKARIFDPFFTTKDPDKGKGIGLAVSYGIIRDHGGTIWAENNDEGGATFIIELPV